MPSYTAPVTGIAARGPGNTYGASRSDGSRAHSGIDISTGAYGGTVVAMTGGVVSYVGFNQGYGSNVVVVNSDGTATRYAMHDSLNSIPVVVGQIVNAGDALGTIGSIAKGRENVPPHLHLEMITDPGVVAQIVANAAANAFTITSHQRGTTDPVTALGIPKGIPVVAGQPIAEAMAALGGVPSYARGDFSPPAHISTQFTMPGSSEPGAGLSSPGLGAPLTGSAASSLGGVAAMSMMPNLGAPTKGVTAPSIYGKGDIGALGNFFAGYEAANGEAAFAPAKATTSEAPAPSVDATPVGLTGGFVAADASSIAPGPFGAEAVVAAALANSPAGVKTAMTAMKNNAMAAVLYGKNLKGETVPNVTGEQAQAAITSYFADIGRSNIAVANQIARNIINNPGLLGQLSPGEQATIVNALGDPGFGKPVSEGGGAIPMLGVQGRDVASLLSTGNYTGNPAPSVYSPAPVSAAVAAQAGKGFYSGPATSPSVFTGGPASISPSVTSQAGKGFYGGPSTPSGGYTGGGPTSGPVSAPSGGYTGGGPTSGPATTTSPASGGYTGGGPKSGPATTSVSTGGHTGGGPTSGPTSVASKPAPSLSAVTYSPTGSAASSLAGATAMQGMYGSKPTTTPAKTVTQTVMTPVTQTISVPASVAAAAAEGFSLSPAGWLGTPVAKTPAKPQFVTKTITKMMPKVITKTIPAKTVPALSSPAAKPAPPAMVGGKPVTGYTPVGRVPYSVATNATPASSGRNGVGAASVYGFGPGGTATTYGTSNGGSISMYSAPTATGGAPGTYGMYGMQSGQPSVVTGGTAGAGAGGTVLCTFFMQKGWLPRDIWKADLRYGQSLPAPTVRGYHLWAVPMVKSMKRGNRTIEKLMWPVVREWARQTAFRSGVVERGSFAGKCIGWVLEPLCFVTGLVTDAIMISETMRIQPDASGTSPMKETA